MVGIELLGQLKTFIFCILGSVYRGTQVQLLMPLGGGLASWVPLEGDLLSASLALNLVHNVSLQPLNNIQVALHPES